MKRLRQAETTKQNVLMILVENHIGPIDQVNELTGADNSIFNQDNNVAVSQDLLLDNDCDGTATNTVFCSNDNIIGENVNNIQSIAQDNIADNSGDAFSNQGNSIAVDQNAGLVNTCDETGTGNNDADCFNHDLQPYRTTIANQ